MNQPLTEAWAATARLQNSCTASTNETVRHVLDLMIDRQIDRIAANHAEPDDPAEARRAIATATRRERHRARLVRLYLVNPASTSRTNSSPPPQKKTTYAARPALTTILWANLATRRRAAAVRRSGRSSRKRPASPPQPPASASAAFVHVLTPNLTQT